MDTDIEYDNYGDGDYNDVIDAWTALEAGDELTAWAKLFTLAADWGMFSARRDDVNHYLNSLAMELEGAGDGDHAYDATVAVSGLRNGLFPLVPAVQPLAVAA